MSGRQAQKVAEKMAAVSRRKQVLCVTHPAAVGGEGPMRNFLVEKGEEGGRTFTRITCLSRVQRQKELARITGGAQITDTLLRSAEEMLEAAEQFRARLH